MKKANFTQLCKEYDVEPRALKEVMKKEGLKRKTATTQNVLNVIYLYSPDLLWCRGAGDGTVEYLEPMITLRLIDSVGNRELVL